MTNPKRRRRSKGRVRHSRYGNTAGVWLRCKRCQWIHRCPLIRQTTKGPRGGPLFEASLHRTTKQCVAAYTKELQAEEREAQRAAERVERARTRLEKLRAKLKALPKG